MVGGSLTISAALLVASPAPQWLGLSLWTWVLGLAGIGLVAMAWPGLAGGGGDKTGGWGVP